MCCKHLPSPGIRRGECQCEAWMPADQGTELAAGVPAGSEDAHRNSMHAECILLHHHPVNRVHRLRPVATGVLLPAYDVGQAMLMSYRHRPTRALNKKQRHHEILEIIASRPVASQEELRRLLRQRSLSVTQSTLSRDLRELRLARIPTPAGVRYASPDAAPDESRASLSELLPQFFASVDGVSELLVLKTTPGGAQPMAEAIDSAALPEVLGTLGGENTVLIICRSLDARERLERRIHRLARRGAH
jgi:transcriptional regulator of arginine metabolism